MEMAGIKKIAQDADKLDEFLECIGFIGHWSPKRFLIPNDSFFQKGFIMSCSLFLLLSWLNIWM